MHRYIVALSAFFFMLTMLFGCTVGRKEWPTAQENQDRFTLRLLSAEVNNTCLFLEVGVDGVAERLYSASIQYETVGEDGGCIGCPFIPRAAKHVPRNQLNFDTTSKTISLNLCGLDPNKEYRFRVTGKSDVSNAPIVYTDVYVTTP